MLDFLLITIIILLLTNWFQLKPFFWKNAGISYKTPLPIVGSMLPSFYTPFATIFKKTYKEMGNSPMLGFHFFSHPALILSDPKLIKKVTITHADHFTDRGIHTEQSYDPMAMGMFFTGGEQWHALRSKMTPYFTPARIKGMLPLVNPIAENFTDYLGAQSKNGPVEVHGASMKLAVDVVMSTVFGLKPDSFVNPDSFFYGLQRELVSFLFGIKMLTGNLSPTLYRILGLTILTKRTTTHMKSFVNDVIDQRITGVGNRPDFVQGMVELMQKEEMKSEHEIKYNNDGTRVATFDRFCITGQCMLMYAAGTETTGNTLSFLLYELAMNPDIQEKARTEIVSMIARTNGQFGFEELHNLHYVQMVQKETLRKYPVLVVFGRKCTRKTELNGVEIPRGALIFISPICLHHDPKYFPEPELFKPERFSDDSDILNGTYAPFGMGPRTCIGMKFAQTEITLALCKLLPKYRLSVSTKTEIPIKFSYNPTLSPANGIWLNVKEIE